MKLKSIPEDFVVAEISDFTPDAAGRFFVYELTKRSLATLEALSIIARKSGMRAKDLSAAGLKDKHGLTTQLFSSTKALRTDVDDDRVTLRLVGKSTDKLTAGTILGNRFEITLRHLNARDVEVLPRNIDEIKRNGVPNYYDNQRFGGIAHGQGFIAKALVRGDFEEALRLHMAVPHRKQNMTDKQNRRLAAKHWGDWDTLHKLMRNAPERALVAYLKNHPDDWAGCFERITPSLRKLFVAAYQSYLFNETLRRLIAAQGLDVIETPNKAGVLSFWRELPPDILDVWTKRELPLLGPGTRIDEHATVEAHLNATLQAEGITLEQLMLDGLKRTSFSSAKRSALVFPHDFQASPLVEDELNEGSSKLTVKFDLPRGSFATIVTRRLVLREDD
ncbi:MAG: tRNA pseudouridine(13) synthase TruD [Planctomycetes bacterium]|nr:tRNA pseudouridine(13) synthase TruD [Planctomycetota bacterium]